MFFHFQKTRDFKERMGTDLHTCRLRGPINARTGEVHPKHLVTCMALREVGEKHHDNAGGSRKLSAVAAGHMMHECLQKFQPALVENG